MYTLLDSLKIMYVYSDSVHTNGPSTLICLVEEKKPADIYS